ncbi:MAG TPA: uroporphyrinogen-III synthase [Acidimicrobiia bacterium]|nr:uroporphyrinogen-III synthase [Acidimicrobiia bacterium]
MKLVAVTTSADRAEAASIPFTFMGLRPVVLPCIEVDPADEQTLDATRKASREAHLLVVSSRRTIDVLWPDGPLPDVEFAVVGAASARAVIERGGRVAVTGSGGSAQLAENLAPHAAGKHLVWPHASGADPAPLQMLATRAARFTAPAIYSSRPIAPPLDRVDAVTFASPSAVAGWQLSRSLDGAQIGVIGETTLRAVENNGGAAAVVAPLPTFQSLAQAVAEHLGVAV